MRPAASQYRRDVVSANWVESHEGLYRVPGTRLSLDSIVYAFVDGQSPEVIAQSFPVLMLEQVRGSFCP